MMELPGLEHWLVPDWQPHVAVRACVTTRSGSASKGPWKGFNLGLNCQDNPVQVQRNRIHVFQQLRQPSAPFWLHQVHGSSVVRYGAQETQVDGVWSEQSGEPCVVLTADCLPVLLARKDGSAVGAFHAGWRGLQQGILDRAAQQMAPAGEALSAWLGPAIGPCCYQIDAPVRDAFLNARQRFVGPKGGQSVEKGAALLDAAFTPDPQSADHWWMDLALLAEMNLHSAGVEEVVHSGLCTACHVDQTGETVFYSHRKANPTGRFATIVWLQQ